MDTQTSTSPAETVPAGVRLVAAFVNTIATLEDLSAWLAANELLDEGPAPLGPDDLAGALAVREALRDALEANCGHDAPAASVDALNRAAHDARLHVSFDACGGATLEPCAGGIDGAIGRIMAAAFTAMADGTWSRLKPCRRASCRWVFYDESKNQSGTWCSMRVCGNREKAARRRAKAR